MEGFHYRTSLDLKWGIAIFQTQKGANMNMQRLSIGLWNSQDIFQKGWENLWLTQNLSEPTLIVSLFFKKLIFMCYHAVLCLVISKTHMLNG